MNIKGIGFVDSGQSQAQYSNRTFPLVCGEAGGSCIKSATFVDKNTLATTIFPQSQVKYASTGKSVNTDPIYIDATVLGNEFTENQVELFYYQDPQVVSLNVNESPANLQS